MKRNQFIESTITLSNKRVSYVNIVKQHSIIKLAGDAINLNGILKKRRMKLISKD